MTNDDIIKLIKKNKRSFEDEDFDTFFSKIPNNQRKDVAEFLMGEVGYPLLQHMSFIPEYFLYKTTLTGITIPDNIEEVQKCAFSDSALKTATFENGGVKNMGQKIFEGCTSLEDVLLPDSLTAIPKECFKDCYNLKKVVMPMSVYKIGTGAFSGCSEDLIIVTPKGKRNTKKGGLMVAQSDIPFFKKVFRSEAPIE